MTDMQLRYGMGFKIDGVPIPDPSAFSGADSALDSMGKRDATGLLHRKMVAQKHPTKLEYNNFPKSAVATIMSLVLGESFQFTFPDPRQGLITVTAYVGDREWEYIWCPTNDDGTEDGEWVVNLHMSVIEF